MGRNRFPTDFEGLVQNGTAGARMESQRYGRVLGPLGSAGLLGCTFLRFLEGIVQLKNTTLSLFLVIFLGSQGTLKDSLIYRELL